MCATPGQALDGERDAIVLREIAHVGPVQATVAEPSHGKLHHPPPLPLPLPLCHHVQEDINDVELSEVLIVDRVVCKVGQVCQNLDFELCMEELGSALCMHKFLIANSFSFTFSVCVLELCHQGLEVFEASHAMCSCLPVQMSLAAESHPALGCALIRTQTAFTGGAH